MSARSEVVSRIDPMLRRLSSDTTWGLAAPLRELVAEHDRVVSQLASLVNEMDQAREMIWATHSCTRDSSACLYGDDGELQCGVCRIDFKRESISEIRRKIEYRHLQQYAAPPTSEQER